MVAWLGAALGYELGGLLSLRLAAAHGNEIKEQLGAPTSGASPFEAFSGCLNQQDFLTYWAGSPKAGP